MVGRAEPTKHKRASYNGGNCCNFILVREFIEMTNHELTQKQMTYSQRIGIYIKHTFMRFRRRYIPYIVWHGQEVNVCVTWKENKLLDVGGVEGAIVQLNRGHLARIENDMNDIGVSFDRGLGCYGRDWEWDWSLSGPISVVFRGPCTTKEKRS